MTKQTIPYRWEKKWNMDELHHFLEQEEKVVDRWCEEKGLENVMREKIKAMIEAQERKWELEETEREKVLFKVKKIADAVTDNEETTVHDEVSGLAQLLQCSIEELPPSDRISADNFLAAIHQGERTLVSCLLASFVSRQESHPLSKIHHHHDFHATLRTFNRKLCLRARPNMPPRSVLRTLKQAHSELHKIIATATPEQSYLLSSCYKGLPVGTQYEQGVEAAIEQCSQGCGITQASRDLVYSTLVSCGYIDTLNRTISEAHRPACLQRVLVTPHDLPPHPLFASCVHIGSIAVNDGFAHAGNLVNSGLYSPRPCSSWVSSTALLAVCSTIAGYVAAPIVDTGLLRWMAREIITQVRDCDTDGVREVYAFQENVVTIVAAACKTYLEPGCYNTHEDEVVAALGSAESTLLMSLMRRCVTRLDRNVPKPPFPANALQRAKALAAVSRPDLFCAGLREARRVAILQSVATPPTDDLILSYLVWVYKIEQNTDNAGPDSLWMDLFLIFKLVLRMPSIDTEGSSLLHGIRKATGTRDPLTIYRSIGDALKGVHEEGGVQKEWEKICSTKLSNPRKRVSVVGLSDTTSRRKSSLYGKADVRAWEETDEDEKEDMDKNKDKDEDEGSVQEHEETETVQKHDDATQLAKQVRTLLEAGDPLPSPFDVRPSEELIARSIECLQSEPTITSALHLEIAAHNPKWPPLELPSGLLLSMAGSSATEDVKREVYTSLLTVVSLSSAKRDAVRTQDQNTAAAGTMQRAWWSYCARKRKRNVGESFFKLMELFQAGSGKKHLLCLRKAHTRDIPKKLKEVREQHKKNELTRVLQRATRLFLRAPNVKLEEVQCVEEELDRQHAVTPCLLKARCSLLTLKGKCDPSTYIAGQDYFMNTLVPQLKAHACLQLGFPIALECCKVYFHRQDFTTASELCTTYIALLGESPELVSFKQTCSVMLNASVLLQRASSRLALPSVIRQEAVHRQAHSKKISALPS